MLKEVSVEAEPAPAAKDYTDPPPASLLDFGELLLWSFYRALITEFIATLLFLCHSRHRHRVQASVCYQYLRWRQRSWNRVVFRRHDLHPCSLHRRNLRYKVVEVFAGGGSALVRWRLETGRTHQIRAHAKYLGVPLLGDELYGGTKGMALSLLKPRIPSNSHGHLSCMVSRLQRPCLHALSLGFTHPHTGVYLRFSCPPPDDFSEVLSLLRSFSQQTGENSDTELEV